MPRAENVTGPVAHHGEGPVWSPSWGGLRFVDLSAGDLLTLRDGDVERRHVGAVAAFVRPRSRGGFVVALESGLALADDEDAEPVPLEPLLTEDGARLNDGTCTPGGALYAGSMAYDGSPGGGRLFRVEPDLTSRLVYPSVGVSNGMGFSPDGSLAYYVDTSTQRVDVLDVQGDQVVGRRPFATVDEADGSPDGLTVDAEGGVWVALWGGSAVRRYAPDGSLDEVVSVPVSQVSACTFGDDDLGTLYVTTSRQDLADDEEPAAGSLFAVRPGLHGLPVLPFGG